MFVWFHKITVYKELIFRSIDCKVLTAGSQVRHQKYSSKHSWNINPGIKKFHRNFIANHHPLSLFWISTTSFAFCPQVNNNVQILKLNLLDKSFSTLLCSIYANFSSFANETPLIILRGDKATLTGTNCP